MTARRIDLGDHHLAVHERGEGTPVLFGHSLTMDSRMWAHQAGALAEHHRVICVDMPAHGGSTARDRHSTLEEISDDLARVLDALDIDRAAWIGHSMGGMCGMRLALRHPDRVARLGLLNTSARSEKPEVAALYHQVNDASRGQPTNAATVDFVFQLMFSPAFAEANPAVVAPFRALLFEPPDAEGVYYTAHAVIARTDVLQDLVALDLPVMVITSADDRSASPRRGAEIARVVADAVHHELRGGHLSPVEQADAVTAHLLSFLEDWR